MNQAYEVLLGVLEKKLGYILVDSGQEDFVITDYIPDSLAFIQFIVALEETLGTELSDDFLDSDLLESARGFAEKLDFFMMSQEECSYGNTEQVV